MNQFLVLFSFLVSSFCFSQRTITGKITDEDGNTIFAASIQIKGTEMGVTSDFDGNYSIEVSPEDVLVFSFIGYDSKEVVVIDQSVIDVTLEYSLELVYLTNCFPLSDHIYFINGINYKTYGLTYKNDYNLLPFNFNFDLAYSSDFKRNTNFHFGLENGVRFSDLVYIKLKAVMETADFNNLRYHSYKLQASKFFSSKTGKSIGTVQLHTGYINYDGLMSSNNFGYGLGFEKSILYHIKVGTSFIHWQQFNEFNANASYTWRRWSITGNYKQLADYEEFQIGLGYNFYF